MEENQKTLEIECQKDSSFNIIFLSELKLNKIFTCDECEELILIVDEELMKQMKGKK